MAYFQICICDVHGPLPLGLTVLLHVHRIHRQPALGVQQGLPRPKLHNRLQAQTLEHKRRLVVDELEVEVVVVGIGGTMSSTKGEQQFPTSKRSESKTVIDWRGSDAKQSLDIPHFQGLHRNCEDISNGTLLSRRAEGRADVANSVITQRSQPCDLQGLPWWLLADQDSPEQLKLRRSGCLHKFASLLLVIIFLHCGNTWMSSTQQKLFNVIRVEAVPATTHSLFSPLQLPAPVNLCP